MSEKTEQCDGSGKKSVELRSGGRSHGRETVNCSGCPRCRPNHRAEAERWLNHPKDLQPGQIDTELARAQAHATLAVAGQLERLNDQLADVIDPTAGPRYPGVVRIRLERDDV